VWVGPSAGGPGDNWPDTGRGARTRKGADAGQVSLCGNTDNEVGTEGQVRHHGDANDCGAQATMAVVAVVNGPEDEPLDWHAVDWRAAEEDVRRLWQRICTGLLEPDARKAC